MEEGTIVKWLKADGDAVSRGDELVEIETDKATIAYEADSDGVLQIVAAEGDTLPIGEVIGRLNGAASEPAAPAEPARSAEPAPPAEPARSAEPAPAPQPAATNGGERVKASPVARRIARERGLELSSLSGSGPGGRIVKADVEAAGGGAAPEPAPAAAAEPGTARGEASIQELTRTQQLIARRMAESKATIPDFALQLEIDMEDAAAMREHLKEVAGEAEVVPSFNDMVVKAAALALHEFPRANGSYRDGRFELHSRVNVGVAVATDDALVVPTVFDVDRKSLGEVARTTRELAGKVRDGTVSPSELSGGTFTVSNLGMYGITSFRAVINPPQAAILAVGAIEPRPVVRKGKVRVRKRMTVTLACDHRILYGADAARFLARIRDLLEQPAALSL
jgi:pyruvate dehydrogenase E2 component (dihydrolipoyllysine-residue acetyltransferase)